jgi:G3E family GTPase
MWSLERVDADMRAAPLVPVSVLTGFLGSGKTTLIARLLRDPALARTAVIVNEFGEVGLDQTLIAAGLVAGGDETVMALTTGCLCCAVRTDLVRTLLNLRAGHGGAYDRVLVETSGLADPAPILHALMTDPGLAGSHAVGAVTVLADAVLGEATLARHAEARRQVAMADRIVLSKTDLAAPSAGLLAALRALNRLAPFAGGDTVLAPVPQVGENRVEALADGVARHSPGLGSFWLERTAPVPAAALALWLQALAEHCGERLLRLKGIVDVAELPGRPAVIHGVQHVFAAPEWLDAWPDAERRSRVVFITRDVDGRGVPRHFPARLLEAVIGEVAAIRPAAG